MTGGGCWCPGTLWKPHHNPTWQLNVYTHRITLALAQRVEWNGKLSETFLISVVFSVITGNCLNEDNVWTFPLQLHDFFFISAILRQIIFLFICSVLYYTFIKKATLFFNPFFSLSLSFAAAGGWHSRGGEGKQWGRTDRKQGKEEEREGEVGGMGASRSVTVSYGRGIPREEWRFRREERKSKRVGKNERRSQHRGEKMRRNFVLMWRVTRAL